MFQIVAKAFSAMFGFMVAHKFSFQVVGVWFGGVVVPELVNMEHLARILASLAAVYVIFIKEYRERKKAKNENNRNSTP